MGYLDKRLTALERSAPQPQMHRHLKQWLGIQLTEEERLEADCYVEPEFDAVDLEDFSPEVREWLGRD